jgi:hypothetical protein
LKKYGKTRGVAGLCIGGGEATAMAVEVMSWEIILLHFYRFKANIKRWEIQQKVLQITKQNWDIATMHISLAASDIYWMITKIFNDA